MSLLESTYSGPVYSSTGMASDMSHDVGSFEYIDAPPWFLYLNQRLDQLWDTYHLTGYPSSDSLRRVWKVANEVLESTTSTPSILPGEEGAVELVWSRNRWHLEIEIGEFEPNFWARHKDTGEVVQGILEERKTEVKRLLKNISD